MIYITICTVNKTKVSITEGGHGVSNCNLGWVTSFIWGTTDDVLRDLYVRGKYRDAILPMTVLRRLDAILEPTKKAAIDMKASLDAKKIVHRDVALRQAAGQTPYNTSKFTLRDLKGRASQQALKADFEAGEQLND